LALSKWKVGGTGLLLRHHLFVWPAFALVVGLLAFPDWQSIHAPWIRDLSFGHGNRLRTDSVLPAFSVVKQVARSLNAERNAK
jgi:hypothetical protein